MLENAWRDVRAQASFVPYAEHPVISNPELSSYVRDWIAHRMPDTETYKFWGGLDISARLNNIAIPALHISGWYDTYLEGSIEGYRSLRKHAANEWAREHQYLLAGPWVHIPWGDRVGDQSLGGAANFDTNSHLLRWFNHWLRDSEGIYR